MCLLGGRIGGREMIFVGWVFGPARPIARAQRSKEHGVLGNLFDNPLLLLALFALPVLLTGGLVALFFIVRGSNEDQTVAAGVKVPRLIVK
jgi:hypothetical protein